MAKSHEPPEPLVDVDKIQAHHVYLALTCALFAASVAIVALRSQGTLVRYSVDMLRAGWVCTSLGYFVKRAEARYSRRLDALDRADEERYADGYSDGYVDGVSRQPPQIGGRRLRPVPATQ